jgi:cell wall-associated NlpC family hydrolase
MINFLKYMEIPFQDHGRDFEGADCWGIVRLVYLNELRIELPSYGVISAKDLLAVAKEMKRGSEMKDWRKVPLEQMKTYDVVVMTGRVGNAKAPIHVGIAIDNRKVMHTEEKTNVVVCDIDHYQLKHRILGAYRYHV